MSEKPKATFGDLVENGWASEDNPTRTGYFVREFRRPHGRMNAGLTWEITNGKGKFWELSPVGEHKITVTPRILALSVPSVGPEPVAWAFEYLCDNGADEPSWEPGASVLNPSKWTAFQYRNIQPLFAHPPAVPVVGERAKVRHCASRACQQAGRCVATPPDVCNIPSFDPKITREWFERKAALEEGCEVGAGFSAEAQARVEALEAERDEAREIARIYSEHWPYGQRVARDEALRAALCAVPSPSARALLSGSTPKPAGVEMQELINAVDFFDRVKAASPDEKIAVGHDHWDRLEAAARALTAAIAPSDGAAS